MVILLLQRYLLRFGHIVKRPWRPVTYQDFVRGLRSLQRFAGLRITGKLIGYLFISSSEIDY